MDEFGKSQNPEVTGEGMPILFAIEQRAERLLESLRPKFSDTGTMATADFENHIRAIAEEHALAEERAEEQKDLLLVGGIILLGYVYWRKK